MLVRLEIVEFIGTKRIDMTLQIKQQFYNIECLKK